MKNINKLLWQLCVVVTLSLLGVNLSFAQCPSGQTAYTINVTPSQFPNEVSWLLINTTTGDTVLSTTCGSYGPSTSDTVCLDDGVSYEFQAFDDWGDGWNGGTYSIELTASGAVVASGSPNDGFPGDNSDLCDGSQLEESATFTAAGPIAGCTDSTAVNYNPNATVDDGSCIFPPSNDDCAGALNLPVGVGPCISGVTSSSVGATYSASAGSPSPACVDFNFNPTPNDLWYVATFTDSVLIFEILNQPGFSTVVELYTGVCDTLVKVDSTFCVNFGNNQPLTISGAPGITLYFRIWDFGNDQFGTFEICAYTPAPPPANDLCTNAITVSCGDTVSGQTSSASNSDNPGTCDTDLSTANGTWYKITGNGDEITASLCGSSYDTKLGVFSGSCGTLTCIAGNDDFCGLSSAISWISNPGTVYYLYVTGFSTSSGNYTLAISCTSVTQPCPTPQNLQAVQSGSNSATISWDPVPQANRYVVRGFVTGQPGLVFLITSDFTNSADISGLVPGVDYWWQVQSICDSSIYPPVSAFSMRDTFSIEACPPVTFTSTSGITATSATANWFPVASAVEYVIFANRIGQGGIASFTVPAPVTFATGNNLMPNTSYQWAVRVRCSPGGPLSDLSPIDTFTTLPSAAKSESVSTGVVDINSSVKLYPNPAQDQLYINFMNFDPVEEFEISIIDLKGQMVYSELKRNEGNYAQLQIPDHLVNGVYQVQIAFDGQLHKDRLVVLR